MKKISISILILASASSFLFCQNGSNDQTKKEASQKEIYDLLPIPSAQNEIPDDSDRIKKIILWYILSLYNKDLILALTGIDINISDIQKIIIDYFDNQVLHTIKIGNIIGIKEIDVSPDAQKIAFAQKKKY